MAPLDIGDVWLGNALTVHRGGICPTTNPPCMGTVFLVSFRLVLPGWTTTTLALLLFPLGPAKRLHPPKDLKALMPLVVQLVVRCCWM